MLHINDVLMFPNGTREVPTDWKWWKPSAEYINTRGREHVSDTSLRAGMVAGFTIGIFIGLILIAVSKILDGTF